MRVESKSRPIVFVLKEGEEDVVSELGTQKNI